MLTADQITPSSPNTTPASPATALDAPPRGASHASTAEPGARALHLGARVKKTVTCTAEALVVINALCQTRRYPLLRISRVVSSSVTDWSGPALALCLSHGIGITWLDGKGHALGTCYPQNRVYPERAVAVELLTETPAGLERYAHWLRSRRMEVLKRWAKASVKDIDPDQWAATKRDWVYGQRFTQHLPSAMRGQCLAIIGAQLAAQGLQPLLWGPDAQRIDLDQDLCHLVWAEMNLCSGGLADTAKSDEPIIELFERLYTHHASALLLHIASLCRTAMKALDDPHL